MLKLPNLPADSKVTEPDGRATQQFWLFFGAIARIIRELVHGAKSLTTVNRVTKVTEAGTIGEAAFSDTDVMLGAPSLTHAGRLPKVSATPGTLEESALTE